MTGRDAKGHFRKGVSGNPGGRPKDAYVRKALRDALLEAHPGDERSRAQRVVEVAFGIAFDEGAKPSERLAAVAWITEQAEGRLPQAITSDEDGGGIVIRFADAKPPEAE